MKPTTHHFASVVAFVAVTSVSFFFFFAVASAACTVSTVYVYGFPITYTTGDCSTTTASPTASLTATPSIITAKGGSTLLSWSSTNATACTGTNFSTGNKKSGSVTVKPTFTTTYVVSCSGNGKSATASRTVTVTSPTSETATLSGGGGSTCVGPYCTTFGITIPPSCSPTLSSDMTNIMQGQSAKLKWASFLVLGPASSGPSMSISNIGAVTPASGGTVSVSPAKTTTYVATCTVTGGTFNVTTSTNSAPVTIVVLPPVSGSCSASPTSINTGQSSTWTASPSGGNGSYTYSWSGTDGLSGNTKSVVKTYTSTGTKTGSVQISSAGSSQTISCSNSVTVTNPLPQCSDGIDNDGDGRIDYPNDYGCTSTSDTSESPNPQCSDGIDNDGDGKIDNADYGCYIGDAYSPTKTSESPNPQCSDGIDNNGNGKIDYPADPACTSPTDGNEQLQPQGSISLLADPELVPATMFTRLEWSANNVQNNSCTLSGTNGDSWALSGTSGIEISSGLSAETVFTLSCTDLDGDPISSAVTIQLVPSFEEI